MKEPGLDARHRDQDGKSPRRSDSTAAKASGTPKVSSERLAKAFDRASKSSGAFMKYRAK